MRADPHAGPELRLHPRPDTLMQLSRSSLCQHHLATHGRTIHNGTGLTLAVLSHCWDERTFAPTSATTQFDPDVWTGRASQEAFGNDEVGHALMYPASLWSLCSGP